MYTTSMFGDDAELMINFNPTPITPDDVAKAANMEKCISPDELKE